MILCSRWFPREFTRNDTTGAQLWRSTNGTTWESILTNGFGNPQNIKTEARGELWLYLSRTYLPLIVR
jgi:hypothetical protein